MGDNSPTTRKTVINLKFKDTDLILINLVGLVHFDTSFLKSWPDTEEIIEGQHLEFP